VTLAGGGIGIRARSDGEQSLVLSGNHLKSPPEAQRPVSRLFDGERGARSAALTLAGPRLCSGYPGHVIRDCCITDLDRNPD
jgi:hypothetical protein